MMKCEIFRDELREGIDSPEGRAHVRVCANCLEHAVDVDPEYLFRSLGGDDLVPPGGVDSFVDDVMQQIHVRSHEQSLGRTVRFPAIARWSIAATFAVAILSAAIWYRPAVDAPAPAAVAVATAQPVVEQRVDVTRPVVENYESSNAMIVEVPTESDSDMKIVMIFDESLPVEL